MEDILHPIKILFIQDINTAQKQLIKRQLSVEEFDYLYDQSIDYLEHLLTRMEITIHDVNKIVEEGGCDPLL